MTLYKINSVSRQNGIIIGVCCDSGDNFSKQEVIDKKAKGDIFYTVCPVTKKVALVEVEHKNGKGFIKSAADRTVHNNLDNLSDCF